MEPVFLKMNMHYTNSIKHSLRHLQFDDKSIPKHILGFSMNYNLTKKRIETFLDDPSFQCRPWEALDEDEQAAAEFNIDALKATQAKLIEEHQAEAVAPKAPAPTAAAKVTPPSKQGKKRSAFKSAEAGTQKRMKVNASTLSWDIDDGRRHSTSIGWEESEEESSDDDDSSDEDHSGDEDDSGDEDETFGQSAGGRKNIRWTDEEDKRLAAAIKNKKSFGAVAEKVFDNDRSKSACYQRYYKFLQPGLIIGNWTKKEDDTIIKMRAEKFSFIDIAKKLPGRNHVTAYDRHKDLKKAGRASTKKGKKATPLRSSPEQRAAQRLAPQGKIPKQKWTAEEDRILEENLDKVITGDAFPGILHLFPNRKEPSIKTRVYQWKREDRIGGDDGKKDVEKAEPESTESSQVDSRQDETATKSPAQQDEALDKEVSHTNVKTEARKPSGQEEQESPTQNAEPEVIDLCDSDNEEEPTEPSGVVDEAKETEVAVAVEAAFPEPEGAAGFAPAAGDVHSTLPRNTVSLNSSEGML